MKILVFDTETTNVPPKVPLLEESLFMWPSIVQLSFILFDTITYKYTEYDYVIKTSENIENDHIHGITNSMNKVRGYSFEYIYPIFKLCVDQCDLLVGHNIKFDISIISKYIKLLKIPDLWDSSY